MPPTLTTTPISQQLYKFSPLGEIVARNLGMTDKNGNGVIDKGAGEGYENLANADVGFHANGVVYGAENGRLEEPEIINHYYINIRFTHPEETEIIDNEIQAYVYANNLPLVWMDDEQGTVMSAVTNILGEGWNNPEVERTEDEAIQMFNRVMRGLNIRGRTGTPSKNGGYYTLPEVVTRKAGYCFETAQFAFWFFSQLKSNSIIKIASLISNLDHAVIGLTSNNTLLDYFGSSKKYNIPLENWFNLNPIQSISLHYYFMQPRGENSLLQKKINLEQVVIYDKYDISNISHLMYFYYQSDISAEEMISLGELVLNNKEIVGNLDNLLSNNDYKGHLRTIFNILKTAYAKTNNITGVETINTLLTKYF